MVNKEEIKVYLESLVGQRYAIWDLNNKLSERFQEPIELINTSEERELKGDPDGLTDWNFMFNSERKETYGYFDIYMLPTRDTKHFKTVYYITEVGYEFD